MSSDANSFDYYAELGLVPTATFHEIATAHHVLSSIRERTYSLCRSSSGDFLHPFLPHMAHPNHLSMPQNDKH